MKLLPIAVLTALLLPNVFAMIALGPSDVTNNLKESNAVVLVDVGDDGAYHMKSYFRFISLDNPQNVTLVFPMKALPKTFDAKRTTLAEFLAQEDINNFNNVKERQSPLGALSNIRQNLKWMVPFTAIGVGGTVGLGLVAIFPWMFLIIGRGSVMGSANSMMTANYDAMTGKISHYELEGATLDIYGAYYNETLESISSRLGYKYDYKVAKLIDQYRNDFVAVLTMNVETPLPPERMAYFKSQCTYWHNQVKQALKEKTVNLPALGLNNAYYSDPNSNDCKTLASIFLSRASGQSSGYNYETYPQYYGSANSIAYPQPVTPSVQEESLIQFDVSALPANATILNATLSLYKYYYGGSGVRSVSVSVVNEPWEEYAVNWKSKPSAQTYSQNTQSVDIGSEGWVNWEIGTWVNSWKNGLQNNGLRIWSDTPVEDLTYTTRFFSSDYALTSQRPKMTVNYCIPTNSTCVPQTLVLQPDASKGKDTYISSLNPISNSGGESDLRAKYGQSTTYAYPRYRSYSSEPRGLLLDIGFEADDPIFYAVSSAAAYNYPASDPQYLIRVGKDSEFRFASSGAERTALVGGVRWYEIKDTTQDIGGTLGPAGSGTGLQDSLLKLWETVYYNAFWAALAVYLTLVVLTWMALQRRKQNVSPWVLFGGGAVYTAYNLRDLDKKAAVALIVGAVVFAIIAFV